MTQEGSQHIRPRPGTALFTHLLEVGSWPGICFCLLPVCLMGLFAGCAFVQPSAPDQEVRARMDLASSYLANDQPRR
ncbi:MAG: hypothetical protein ACOC5H_03935, partial [Desulfovermiculus sp.]